MALVRSSRFTISSTKACRAGPSNAFTTPRRRERAQAFYNDTWRERLRTVYGATPEIQFFDVHAVVDNDAHTMRIDA